MSDFPPASSKEFLEIQATIECGFTLERVRDIHTVNVNVKVHTVNVCYVFYNIIKVNYFTKFFIILSYSVSSF